MIRLSDTLSLMSTCTVSKSPCNHLPVNPASFFFKETNTWKRKDWGHCRVFFHIHISIISLLTNEKPLNDSRFIDTRKIFTLYLESHVNTDVGYSCVYCEKGFCPCVGEYTRCERRERGKINLKKSMTRTVRVINSCHNDTSNGTYRPCGIPVSYVSYGLT